MTKEYTVEDLKEFFGMEGEELTEEQKVGKKLLDLARQHN